MKLPFALVCLSFAVVAGCGGAACALPPSEAKEKDTFLWFRLTAEPTEGPITLDVTGRAGTRELLKAL